jgi:molybdopterin-guanine dinucleotide biosynthesis protein A
VLSGLTEAGGLPALLLAVDLPLVPASLLARLVELAEGWDVVVPVSPRGPEPVCALYGPACLGPILRNVEAGEMRMTAFWPGVRVRRLPTEELALHGDPGGLFLNLNAPTDLGGGPGVG